MRYKTEAEMDNRVERIIKAKVKHYYTDWKNYDRPKYMKLKGEHKKLILAVRDCGTWLFVDDENLKENDVYNYVVQYEGYRHDFYKIDTERYEVKKVKEGK